MPHFDEVSLQIKSESSFKLLAKVNFPEKKSFFQIIKKFEKEWKKSINLKKQKPSFFHLLRNKTIDNLRQNKKHN